MAYEKTSVKDKSDTLGKQVKSWIYKPPKSNKFVYYIIGLLLLAAIFAVTFGEEILPILKELPDIVIYALPFIIGPLVSYFKSRNKDHEYTLYEHGFQIKYLKDGRYTGEEGMGYWHDYDRVTYDDKGVKLISSNPAKRNFRIRAQVNVMEIYSICRERISIVQAKRLDSKSKAPGPPNTKEQRRVAKMEERHGERERGQQWDWDRYSWENERQE